MLGSDILDVFIGLSFIYFFLSLVCMWVQEILTSIRELKAKNVLELIQNLLDSEPGLLQKKSQLTYNTIKDQVWKNLTDTGEKITANIVKAFFEQPIIKSLYKGKRLPSKINEKDFAMALVEILKQVGLEGDKNTPVTLDVLKAGAKKIKSESSQSVILTLIENAEMKCKDPNEKINMIYTSFESWFNSVKERASGWYKRNIQISVFIISVIVAAGFNADTLDMFTVLWNQPVIRTGLSEIAITSLNEENQNKTATTKEKITEIENQLNDLKSVNTLIGWDSWLIKVQAKLKSASSPKTNLLLSLILFKILGILLTAFGISQGSSFWYDTIKRFVGLREGESKKAE